MRTAALIGTPVLVLSVTACGSRAATPAELEHAAAKTAAQKSVYEVFQGAIDLEGERIVIAGNGVFDNRTGRARLSVTSYTPRRATIAMVISGARLYLRSTVFSRLLPRRKKWIELDLRKASATPGADVTAATLGTPTRALGQLRRLDHVKRLGAELVGGARTTHYSADVSFVEISKYKLERLLNTDYDPIELWIGEDGLVHRLHEGYTADVARGSGIRAHTEITADLSDFGQPVSVDVPKKRQTLDLTNLAVLELKRNGG